MQKTHLEIIVVDIQSGFAFLMAKDLKFFERTKKQHFTGLSNYMHAPFDLPPAITFHYFHFLATVNFIYGPLSNHFYISA